ncbi:unnamed protein product [Discosporangium mesarthrocarpum]
MKLPPGCGEWSGKTVRLHRALYGLKQASRTWGRHLTKDLISLGFEQCLSDPCVFRYFSGQEILLMLAHHIDDMFVVGDASDCNVLCAELNKAFPAKNLGELKWYTGCAFTRDRKAGKFKVTQTAYIDQICERFAVTTTALFLLPHH